jgi:hypothetical protein
MASGNAVITMMADGGIYGNTATITGGVIYGYPTDDEAKSNKVQNDNGIINDKGRAAY